MTVLTGNIDIDNLHLRNFVNLDDEELALVLSWRNSEVIKKLVSFDPRVISFSEHKEFVKGLSKRSDKCYYLVQGQDRNLGVVCLINIDFHNKRCMWGDYANPSFLNRGIGLILEYAALYVAFEILSFHCLRCETLENNEAAKKLHIFFGFETEGILRDYAYNREDDTYKNVVVMSITDKQWNSRKDGLKKILGALI